MSDYSSDAQDHYAGVGNMVSGERLDYLIANTIGRDTLKCLRELKALREQCDHYRSVLENVGTDLEQLGLDTSDIEVALKWQPSSESEG